MDARETRRLSLSEAKRLGFAEGRHLPLLDDDMRLRSSEALIDRSLALHAVVSTAFGFPTTAAQSWLVQEGLEWMTTARELAHLESQESMLRELQDQVEALNAFAWVLGFVPEMPFDRECVDDLITVFPDLKAGASSSDYRNDARLRLSSEAFEALDLAYCLHWAVVDAQLNGRSSPRSNDAYIIVERRRALEWMMSDVEWDDVSLDT